MQFGFMIALAGLIFFAMGVYFFWQARQDWLLYRLSQDWVSAKGQMLQSKVSVVGNTHRSFIITIRYRYEVDGRVFNAKELAFGSEKAIYW
ncbi:MAG TPA: DUF3592 domain-containing protein, partial [Pseudomonadales bacterium]|nr:DUF3592 domain-containing protein [Pseudomonadales bacterium]